MTRTAGSPTLGSQTLLGSRFRVAVAPASPVSSTAFRQVATMAKKKGVRLIVTIECTEAKGKGETPSRYVTQKVRTRGGGAATAACGCSGGSRVGGSAVESPGAGRQRLGRGRGVHACAAGCRQSPAVLCVWHGHGCPSACPVRRIMAAPCS